ncbi:50S ribosomal protein L13 [Schleiferia thermophila]|uniref:Large ribosomal subunit protein uL13 n=1 Tax=Schleiferia thermophila TaxID=884107 RepID=A0A369A6Z5_9FLAO|nr:50S ribosomal protein L13 [Schleiferia thermophila]RCX04923.1 LSU ribosomal protein L13P [Schleiferia thermophila]GCD79554.1 50S ribosomal protein L13 [Schleiferia thermophila]
MDTISYKTVSVAPNLEKKWYIVDATGLTLGRLVSVVAKIARGKHKPSFTPHINCGDHVIIINADKVALSGNKLTDKEYVFHTGYPGGQYHRSPKELMSKNPTRVVELALKGMLPKNKLGRDLFRNVKVYAGAEHNHEAQKPEVLNINEWI